MLFLDIRHFLLPILFSTQIFAESRIPLPKSFPRSIDAVLIEPADSPAPTSSAPKPFLKYLDLRQVAAPAAAPGAAQPAAPVANNPNAPANPNPPAKPAAPAANPNAVAPAAAPVAAPAAGVNPEAPVVGVGGAGNAPAGKQPGANAQANPVTTMMVDTVIGGKTTQVPQVYTQTFAAAGASAPPVKKGTIGMGTLTGKVGVVKTSDAKSDALPVGGGRIPIMEVMVLMIAGVAALGGGVLGIARL